MATELLPWVLIRRDKPRTYFGSLDGAKKFYDQLRFNGPRQPDAMVRGPGREGWYCRGSKEGYWVRDDERRRPDEDVVDDAEATA